MSGRSLLTTIAGHLRPLPVLEAPSYVTESARILAEITLKKIRARTSTTRRVIVEHLGHDYTFRSLLGDRLLTFKDPMEARECYERVQRMDEYTRKGFEVRLLRPTMLRARIQGRHYL
jgi:hypothetical protein